MGTRSIGGDINVVMVSAHSHSRWRQVGGGAVGLGHDPERLFQRNVPEVWSVGRKKKKTERGKEPKGGGAPGGTPLQETLTQ